MGSAQLGKSPGPLGPASPVAHKHRGLIPVTHPLTAPGASPHRLSISLYPIAVRSYRHLSRCMLCNPLPIVRFQST